MKHLFKVREALRPTEHDPNSEDQQERPLPPQLQMHLADPGTDIAMQTRKDLGNGEMFSSNSQAGVQKVEAAAIVWDKKHLIAAYALYVVCPVSYQATRI